MAAISGSKFTELFNQSDDLVDLVPGWCPIVLSVYLVIILCIGIPGNSLVVLVQASNVCKNAADWFVYLLAISDLVSLLVCVPVTLLICLDVWEIVGFTFWCQFHMYVLHSTSLSSTCLVGLIGLERYCRTVKVNKKNADVLTGKRALYSGVTTILFSALLHISQFFMVKNNRLGHCTYEPAYTKILQYFHFGLLLISVVIVVFLVIIYSRIMKLIYSRRVRPDTEGRSSVAADCNQKIRQTSKVMALVTLTFILTTSVPAIFGVLLHILNMETYYHVRILTFFLIHTYLIRNVSNPIFYILMYPAFRKKMILILKNAVCRTQ